MSGQKSQKNIYLNLHDVSQFDWDKIVKTGDLSIVGITEENYFFLIDELSELLGTKKNVKLEIIKLKRLHSKICDYALNLDGNSELDYLIELRDNEKKEVVEDFDIMPYITKAYGYINKKNISVYDYTQLYISLRDGKIHI
jgi:hypothetical protein